MKLNEIYKKYEDKTDKGSGHSYIETYEEIMSPFINKEIVLLELGVSRGFSLLLWKEYLPNAIINGIDLKKIPGSILNKENIFYFRMDCTNKEKIEKRFIDNKFDIIIDDASHRCSDQIASFNIFYNNLNAGGIYVIEDVVIENVNALKSLSSNCEVRDFRKIKNRHDDIMIIYRK